MRAELIRLHRRLGVTTVYVTHDQVEAMTMGQRIAVMKDGILQQYDTPETIYRYPVNTFVATFIGTPPMNLLKTPVHDGAALLAGSSIPLPSRTNLSSVILGIRPEAFHPAPPGIPFAMKVDVVELLGATKTVYLQGEHGALTAVLPHDAPSPEGSTITLYVKEEDIHFFDPHSSQSLR
jgi:multiple sugar transport system ATP-binding protein